MIINMLNFKRSYDNFMILSYDKVMVIRLQNDLYCVEWGVKLYSLTHSSYGHK